jgi:fatty-acyl-CoA synthase
MAFTERLRNDYLFASGIAKTLMRVIPVARNKTRTFSDVAEDLARRYGDRPALISERESLTYAAFNARANRYARWAMANGIRKRDTVCLLMLNRPEYPAVWLGISRAGGVVALLNTNLAGQALAHCINIVEPKAIIVGAGLADVLASAEGLLTTRCPVWSHGDNDRGWPRIDEAVAGLSDEALAADQRPSLTLEDRCLYIYTSGTTGLPKAANIHHYRVLAGLVAFASVTGATERDRMYDCLPLYHTVGGVLALAPLVVGGSVFIREKFSARQFWDDVVDRECTLFQYVGELCRYLLNAPVHPREASHRIRLCCGNGLRPDIWTDFKNRFRVPEIREFYAATEGNVILFNFDGTPGSVGRCPNWARFVFPTSIIRLDLDREEPVRGPDGFCVPCDPDEVGEVISRILNDPLKPGQRFDGYADRAASEKKMMRDVFEKGDLWFRSGDLMRRDARGYFFFIDRIGDTYRWKGENVSTHQVAETISTLPGIHETNVYGVAVKGRDGKAGMAAVVPGDGFDLAALRAHIHARLPPFARPLFIRLQQSIDATSTFKQRKIDLVRDGFDPSRISEPLYFDDGRVAAYVTLDPDLYRRIESGEIRL